MNRRIKCVSRMIFDPVSISTSIDLSIKYVYIDNTISIYNNIIFILISDISDISDIQYEYINKNIEYYKYISYAS